MNTPAHHRTDCVPAMPSFAVDGTEVVIAARDHLPRLTVARCASTVWAVRIAGMLNAAQLRGDFDE
jgi:hypothetical protein